MAGVKDVSGTAFVVAEFRAEENHQLRPLYRDPVVEMFLDEDTRHAAKLIADSFPPVKDMVRIRTKYLDDTLDRHIASGFRQVVILGAGLDTRAVRKQAAGVTYFEIDDAATMRLKQVRYDQRGIDADVRLMPGNYVTDGLMDLLARNGFEAELPTYFIWEGNTMYLPLETDKNCTDRDQNSRPAVPRLVRLHDGGCDYEDHRRRRRHQARRQLRADGCAMAHRHR